MSWNRNLSKPHNNYEYDLGVGIITFHRNDGLLRLLRSLMQQSFQTINHPKWKVVVVDNDHYGIAKNATENLQQSFPVPLIYDIEPTQGIASARNKVVSLTQNSEFLAFIDDDEVAETDWLEQLLIVQSQFHADIVTGPILPEYEQTPPQWIKRGRFFERRRLETGSLLDYAATNNILIKTKWFQKVDGPFDTRLNLTGGSDKLFTTKAHKLGAKIVWADEAVVTEINPPERVKSSWLIKRYFRIGYTKSLVNKLTGNTISNSLRHFFSGVYRILLGLMLLIPYSLLKGYAGTIQSIRHIAHGWGEIFGLMGGRYEEYADQSE